MIFRPRNIIVVLFGFLLILIVGLKKINDFGDYFPTVIVINNQFDLRQNKQLLAGEKINQEFKSKYNNLGTISIKFDTDYKINKDTLQFSIKEVGSENWYYTNKYNVEEFQNNEYFSFGFPQIEGSKNKKYQIEITSLNGIEGESVSVVTKDSYLLTRYSFPKSYLLQNKNTIPKFLFDKTKSFFNNVGLKNYIYILILSSIFWLTLTKKNIKKLSNYIHSEKFKLHASIFGLLVIYNVLTLTFAKQMLFSDEADNLIGGKMISSGYLMYKDFYSQHTPLMYYICAFISWLGASSIVYYRIYFFFLMSLIWIFMYVRYGKHFGKLTMVLYPFIYIFILGHTSLGNTILSEQIQSSALVILLLEFLLYEKNKLFKFNNYIAIALAVFFSIGTAMVSVFPVFVFFVGVFVLQISWIFKNKKDLFNYLKSYLFLIIFTLVPFLIMIGIYYKQGVLSNAFYQIFTFNTQVYSKYNGGYGSSIFSTFEMPIYKYPSFVTKVINGLFTANFIVNAQFLIGIVSVFIFVWSLIKNNKKIVGIFSFLFVVMCGTRSYEDFHSIPYYALTAIIFSIIVYRLVYFPYKNSGVNNNFSVTLVISSIIILSTSFFMNYRVLGVKDFFKDTKLNSIQLNILKLTNKNDRIFVNTLDGYTYLATNRLPASKVWSFVPWFADIYQNEVIDDLEKNKTKIIIYTPDLDIWGYKAKNFEPELQKYIENNYTKLNKSDPYCIEWIRNDYLIEIKR